MSLLGSFLGVNLEAEGWLKDQEHARAVYRDDNLYDLAPKAGWIYYVRVGINPAIRDKLNKSWAGRFAPMVGLLAKNVDLPKFKITTETMNQYNRKTVVQSKLNYEPVTITFHDDMANATTNLWRNYYSYYFAEGGDSIKSGFKNSQSTPDFKDNKYDADAYTYGLANNQNEPFFKSIDIYLLNKQRFTLTSLINPVIKEWQHSSVGQTEGSKFMESRMTLEYETVLYKTGSASKVGFTDDHYDRNPSPLSIVGGNKIVSLAGPGGIIPGASALVGAFGDIDESSSPLDLVTLGVQAANLAKNASKLTQTQIKQEGYSILQGQLGNLARVGFSGYTGGLLSTNLVGGVANLFSDPTNTSVNGGTVASNSNVPANAFQNPGLTPLN
jgi:hypothetical protein